MNDIEVIRREWYSKVFIKFEIVKVTKDREMAMIGVKPKKVVTEEEEADENFDDDKEVDELEQKRLPTIRLIKSFAVDFLKLHFDKFRFYQRNFNLYISNATFSEMPMLSFIPEERKKQLGDFFNGGGFERAWMGYDFFLDIDNDDPVKAYLDACKVKKVLDEFNVPYYLLASGNKGWHFVCEDAKFFSVGTSNSDKVLISYAIAENIKEIEDVPSLDMSVFDKERLRKCPYSLVGENVALPFTDEMFHSIKGQVHYKWVLDNVKIMNRGLLERKGTIKYRELLNIYGKLYE